MASDLFLILSQVFLPPFEVVFALAMQCAATVAVGEELFRS